MPVKTPLFFLSSSYNELNIFFPSFCSAKVKQNNFLIKLFLHQNISSFWNKQFISRQMDVQETKENEGPAAPISPASFFQNCQWWGHFWDLSSRLRSQLCLKGFQFASPVKWASHCALPFSLTLDSWCFSIYKNVFQSCKYRGNTYWDFFLPWWLMHSAEVRELQFKSMQAALNTALPCFAWQH